MVQAVMPVNIMEFPSLATVTLLRVGLEWESCCFLVRDSTVKKLAFCDGTEQTLAAPRGMEKTVTDYGANITGPPR